MIYAISDLHGLKLAHLQALLAKAQFSDNDWLYILGDVIDRQNDGGVEVLQWLLTQPNVQLLMGNHEVLLLSCSFMLDEITDESVENFTPEKMKLLLNYLENGGGVTLNALKALRRQSPDTLADIWDYLHDAPLYETVTAGGQDFLLVHAGLGHFHPRKRLSEYRSDDFLWAQPAIDERYFDDIITVFGHTATLRYGKEHSGKILHTDTWIDIDVGIPYGNAPAMLCLDTLQEIYL